MSHTANLSPFYILVLKQLNETLFEVFLLCALFYAFYPSIMLPKQLGTMLYGGDTTTTLEVHQKLLQCSNRLRASHWDT